MGLARLIIEGVEADDVIATLARQARGDGKRVLLSSGDKDLTQLVDDAVVLEDTMQDRRYDPAAVEERFGVAPALIGDLLALTGDSSDNIPGIDKVGPKTAAKWLAKYGDLDAIIEQADDIGGKVGENLRAGLEQLRLSRQLVALDGHVELGVKLADLAPRTPDRERMVELLSRFGFATWLKQVDGDESGGGNELDVETVTTRKQLDSLVEKLGRAGLIALDRKSVV